MSKHERLHGTSRGCNTTLSEAKRSKFIDVNYSNHLIQDDKIKLNNDKTNFSTCFLTDNILMPDEKKSLEYVCIIYLNNYILIYLF